MKLTTFAAAAALLALLCTQAVSQDAKPKPDERPVKERVADHLRRALARPAAELAPAAGA